MTVLDNLKEVVNKSKQDKFDLWIGRLHRILSELTLYTNSELDEQNKQTLKTHAKNMIAVSQFILNKVKDKEEKVDLSDAYRASEEDPLTREDLLRAAREHGNLSYRVYCPTCNSRLKHIRYKSQDAFPCEDNWHKN